MKPSPKTIKAIAILSLVLAACGGGTPSPTPTPPTTACDPSVLVAPTPSAPHWGGIWEIGYSSIEWTWPLSTCDPESYVIDLNTEADFSGTALGGSTGTPDPSWGPSATLDPATVYYWRVRASSGGSLGPWSIVYSFVTDPVCDPVNLVSPLRDIPVDGSVLTTLNPEYDWTYPSSTCTPEGYHLQISDVSDMSSLVMYADNPHIATTGFMAGVPLDDCNTYYWYVAASVSGIEGPFSDIGSFNINAASACICDPADLTQPVPVWPSGYEIVGDLLPILEWNNPGFCDPEGYAVSLSTEYDFSDTSLFGGTGSSATNWMPGLTLDPATQYFWKVAGGVGIDFGPYSPIRSFFTGPECTTLIEVMAPERLSPPDGTQLSELFAVLKYAPGAPGCIPDGYFLDLQTDPTFAGTNLLTEYGIPGTTVITDPLADCTIYYWRVAAVQDGAYGPFSDTGWFLTNESGACGIPMASALILENLNCRLGPDRRFEATYVFMQGDLAEVAGRNADGTHFVFWIPNTQRICWASVAYATLFGSQEDLEIYREPPLPIAEPTTPACVSTLPTELCKAAGGEYIELVSQPSYCECP